MLKIPPGNEAEIAVCSLYCGLEGLRAVTEPNRVAYCWRHGYPYYAEYERLDPLRPASWSKVLLLLRHLHKHEYLLWIDADAAILRPDWPLHDIADPEADVIWRKDTNGINCGVMMLRNSPATHALLWDCYRLEDFKDRQWWEQAAIMHLLEVRPDRIRQKVVDHWLINSYPWEELSQSFIVHVPGPLGAQEKASTIAEHLKKAAAAVDGASGALDLADSGKLEALPPPRVVHPDRFPRNAIAVGPYSAQHLGDTLCTTTLPRLLSEKFGALIFIADNPMTRIVFAGNPHVAGFVGPPQAVLEPVLMGEGHTIQRLEQGQQVAASSVPRPEVYLSDSERAWAAAQRRRWPGGRPVCLLSTAAITDGINAGRVDWARVAAVLSEHFTIVQPVLEERPVPQSIVLRKLPLRGYMALFSVADAFVGATSGGSHLAAAFDVPSLIVSWRALVDTLRFPVGAQGFKATFLYPQQWHVASEDFTRQSFRIAHLRKILDEMTAGGGQCRAYDGSAPPAAFEPAPVAAATRCLIRMGRRVVRVPEALARQHAGHARATQRFG